MSDVGAPSVVQIRWIDADNPPDDLNLRSADEWQILLELDGTACAQVRLPNPGDGVGAAFLAAALLRHADSRRALRTFVAGFRDRLGAPRRACAERSCSVVIATHRRPEYLQGALDALAALDPPPFEVIVVDNDPGDADCREQAERAGARYVREDRRGLNAARTAGARAARGELVAYLDDDCIPSPHWLGQLAELFDDPLVAAVTGPAFAHELTTPAQRRRDAIAGFVHGFGRMTYDWTTLRPVHAGRVGAGANMIFRRERLAELGDPFPPDLDAGTAAQTGGDLYALYRVLAAGYRVIYDPATYVFHRHRADGEALLATVRGYGIGASAFLTKALVEHGELASFAIWRWLPQQYLVALMARIVGRGDAVTVRLRWEYLWNGFRGPAAWARARRMARAGGPLAPIAPLDPRPEPTPGAPPGPGAESISVVICGADPDAVGRCRAALRDSGHDVVTAVAPTRAAARNDGAARAAGDILLFLDAELIPDPDLAEQHLARMTADDEPDVVLGYNASSALGGLADKYDALWWEDHFKAKRDAVTLTFADFVGANMSVRRPVFERVGGFDEAIEAHDDWDWGARAVRAGVRAVFTPAARALRTAGARSPQARIAQARQRGRDELRLFEQHGVVLPPGPERGRLASLVPAGDGRPVAVMLDLLERAHARRTWLRLFRIALGAARERGWREAGGSGRPGAAAPVTVVDLDGDEPIPVPRHGVPTLELRRGGRPIARVSPRRSQWHGGLADDVVGRLGALWWPQRAERWWTELPRAAVAVSAVAAEPSEIAVTALAPGEDHWRAADGAIRAADDGTPVALLLPGTSARENWAAAIAPAFEASRVAAVVGAGLRPDEPLPPLIIHSRATLPGEYALGLGSPFQYIAVSPRIYASLGGFDLDAAGCGHQGPVLDFIERALCAGYVIGYRDTPGLDPAGWYRPARSENEWQRWAAGGALLARSARHAPGIGGWLRLAGRFMDGSWSRLIAGKGRRWWLGTRLAFLSGVVRGRRR